MNNRSFSASLVDMLPRTFLCSGLSSFDQCTDVSAIKLSLLGFVSLKYSNESDSMCTIDTYLESMGADSMCGDF